MADGGAGGYNKTIGFEDLVADLERLWREKAGALFVEGEAAVVQLLAAVVGEFTDQPRFTVDNGREVGAHFDWRQAKLGGAFEVGGDFGRAQDGLAGHAAAQDAKPSPGAVVDDGDVSPGLVGCARRGIAC